MPEHSDYVDMAKLLWDSFERQKMTESPLRRGASLSDHPDTRHEYLPVPWSRATMTTRLRWVSFAQTIEELPSPREILKATRTHQRIEAVRALQLSPRVEIALLAIERDIREGYEEEYAFLRDIIKELREEIVVLRLQLRDLEDRTHG